MGASSPPKVALETTLLLHGVPRDSALPLFRELSQIVRENGAEPVTIGVIKGKPVVGLSESQFLGMLAEPQIVKLNTANLGIALHRAVSGATTVSTTMELAAAAGIRVFATGAIGGVHAGYGKHLDISTDLAALARFPVAVISSGVKSILDVRATREVLETLGVPVIGYRTTEFPAFYLRRTDEPIGVDATFDTAEEIAPFARSELSRTGRGMLIANPIPESDELPAADWARWLAEARAAISASQAGSGRDATPLLLSKLHEVSGGATLRANIALVKSNAALAAQIAAAMPRPG